MSRIWLGVGLGVALSATSLSAVAKSPPPERRAADRQAIVEGERAWGQAYVTGDVGAVERLLADGFRGIDPRGGAYDKASVLKVVREGPHSTSDEVGPVTVRFYGDTAIAQAHEHEVGPAPERRAAERVFTDTWVRLHGRWRIVAAEDLDPAVAAPTVAGEAFPEDRQAILALRAENNRAIAAHDLDATMRIVAEDSVLVGGNSGIERSFAENRKGWSEEFARPGHDRYVRSPTDLQIGERKGVLRAAESGTWEGIDHKPSGESRPFGRYFVHWSKLSGQWRVVSETYVTLGCKGSGC